MDGTTYVATPTGPSGMTFLSILLVIVFILLVFYYFATKKGKKSPNKKGAQPAVVVGTPAGAAPAVVV